MNLTPINTTLLVAQACLVLSGCLAPKIDQKPALQLPAPKAWESDTFNSDNNYSSAGWAYKLGGEQLNSLIEKAISGNPSLLAMSERLIAQGEQATILGSKILPTAQAEVTGSRSKRNLIGFNLPNGSTSFTSNSFTSGLNITWELDLWGKLADARDSAEKSFRASEMELQGAQISLAGQVAKGWYEVIEGSQQVLLAQKSAVSLAQNQNFVEERFRKGLANALDQKLAQTGTAHAEWR